MNLNLLARVVVLAVIVGSLFLFFGPTPTEATVYSLADGYAVTFVGKDVPKIEANFFKIQFDLPWNNEIDTKIKDTLVKFNDAVQFINDKDLTNNYYPSNGKTRPGTMQQLSRLTFSEDEDYELITFYNEDGSINFSKTILGKIPKELRNGRPIMDEVPDYTIDESNPETYTTGENGEKIPTGTKLIQRPGFNSRICFDTGSYPMGMTGLCQYYTISVSSKMSKLSDEDIEKVNSLITEFYGERQRQIEGFSIPFELPQFDEVTIFNPAASTDKSKVKNSPESETITPSVVESNPDQIAPLDSSVFPSKTAKTAASKFPPDTSFNNTKNGNIFPLNSSFSSVFGSGPFSSNTAFFVGEDVDLLNYGFESVSLPTGWTSADYHGNNDLDYWAPSDLTSYNGSKSGWSAEIGKQVVGQTHDPYEGFENTPFSGWTVYDNNPSSGEIYWGQSSNRKYSGSWSAYVAAVNGSSTQYSNDMDSYLLSTSFVNTSLYDQAVVTYRIWYDTEAYFDTTKFIFSPNNGSNWYYFVNADFNGNSNGWVTITHTIPSQYLTNQFKYGFRFRSDDTVVDTGVNIDEFKIEWGRNNNEVARYDDYMDARLTTPSLNLSTIYNPELKFVIYSQAQSSDFWEALISEDGGNTWFTLDGGVNTAGWVQKTLSLANYLNETVKIRFRFYSDSSNHNYEGTYIDNVRVHGNLKLPNGYECSSANQCQSGTCGGGHTDHFIHCNNDGSTFAYGDSILYVNTCGGGGSYDQTNYDDDQEACVSLRVCDIDLNYVSSTFTNSGICKRVLSSSCSVNSDCWNDNGGVDCMGSSSKICTYGNNGDYCTESAQCDSNQCFENQCSSGIPNGQACTNDLSCASDYCVAGFCQSQSSYAPAVVRTDSWDSSNSGGHSTSSDGMAFVNSTVYPNVTGLREQTDMICYDFDGNGAYDACYYDLNGCDGLGCSAISCNHFTIPSNSSIPKYVCDIDAANGCRIGLDGGTQPTICTGASCIVSTASGAAPRMIAAKAYTDCNDSDQLRSETTVLSVDVNASYSVSHAKYFRAGGTEPNVMDYDVIGQFGYSDQNAVSGQSFICPTNYAVDRVAEEQRVYTPGGTIPSVCKLIPGQSCTSNSQCLYNVCANSQCATSGGIKGHLYDETGHPLANKTMKLYTCSNTLVSTTTTDTYGKYGFYNAPGNYKLKSTMPWGDVTFIWAGESSGCHAFPSGFYEMYAIVYTSAHIEGRAVTPDGFPSVGLNFDASTCSNTILDTDTTNSNGDFDLYTDVGNQKVNVTLDGTRYPIVDGQGNSCVFRAGNVNLGNLEITADCTLYDDTCSDANPNVRLFNCSQATANGCSCQQQECVAGCTEGAPQCNVLGTGTLKITISDVNGNPVSYADIIVDGQSRGRTNGYGKKDVNTPYGSHSVRAVCATGSPFVQQSTYLNANQRFINLNLNCPVPPKGDIVIHARSLTNYPVANVIIEIDETEVGQTTPFGVYRVGELPYGPHVVTIHYGIMNDQNIVTPYSKTMVVDVNSGVTSRVFQILMPGQPGFSALSDSTYTPSFLPLLAAADVASFYLDVQDYCNCMFGDKGSIFVNACVENLTSPQCSDLKMCIDGVGSFLGQSLNQCPLEGAFLLGDTVAPLIPLGFLKHTAIHFIGFGLARLDDFRDGVQIIEKTNDAVKHIKSGVKKIGEKVDASFILKNAPDVGISLAGMSANEIKVIEDLVQRAGPGGEDAFKALIGQSDNYFTITEQYMKNSYKKLTKLKSELPSQEYAKLEQKLVNSRNNFGNAKGTLGEIEGGASSEFENRLLKYDSKPPGSSREFDFEVDDGFVEVKTTNMLQSGNAQVEINNIIEKGVEWHDLFPDKKFYVRFKFPINDEVSSAISNGIINRRPDFGLSMLSVSTFT